MLDIGIYNALLSRVGTGAFTEESIALAAGVTHPCVDYVKRAPFPCYVINNYCCLEMPVLEQYGEFLLRRHFPLVMYNTRQMTHVLGEDELVEVIGVKHHRLEEGIFDPWVVFATRSGKQGEFSMNVWMRLNYSDASAIFQARCDVMSQAFSENRTLL